MWEDLGIWEDLKIWEEEETSGEGTLKKSEYPTSMLASISPHGHMIFQEQHLIHFCEKERGGGS